MTAKKSAAKKPTQKKSSGQEIIDSNGKRSVKVIVKNG
jgi:hypothetical protein